VTGGQEHILDQMPWFGDEIYAESVALTDKEEAWFFRCVWHQWKFGSMPIDEQSIRKVARPEFGTTIPEWHRFYEKFPGLFPSDDEYSGRNRMVAEKRADYIRVFEAKSLGGKRSGETRRKQKEVT